MERNERFTQRILNQSKNNLSPFGQKIFNVLLNNRNTKEKQCCQNKYNIGCDRRFRQKRRMLHFDDSSTSRPPLLNHSEQSDGYLNDGSRNPCSNNMNTIRINDHDVGDVPTTAKLFPIETAGNNGVEEISISSDANLFQFKPVQNNTTTAVPKVRLLQITPKQNNLRKDFSNDTDPRFRLSPPAQNNTVKVNPSAISAEFEFSSIQNDPKKVKSNFTFANVYENQSVHNRLSEVSTDITSAGLLKFHLNQNNYKEDRATVTSAELLQTDSAPNPIKFLPIQNIGKEGGFKISPTILLLDSVPRTPKKYITDDDGSLGVFDYSLVKDDSVEDRSLCKLDLLKPLEFNRSKNPVQPISESYNESLDIFTLSTPVDKNLSRQMDKNSILWNDMFDTELLPGESHDLIAPAVKEKIIHEQNAIINRKQFKISFPKENTKKLAHTDKNEKENKYKPELKRKREKTLNKEKRSKKLKESNLSIKKNIVRKEKYTSTVKKWLDAVDPNNPVETENIQVSGNVDLIGPIESGKETCSKILDQVIIEDKKALVPKKRNDCKKVVQARLANKGGVMKFDKPVQQERGKDDASSDTTSARTASKATNRVSLKKGKPKFVAPLKSQKPVKEIEFNVVVVDENNWKAHVTKLQNSNTSGIYAVLTYSNGFCQLNKQFTEEDCVPDGVMLLIDEDFYYFQKIAAAFSDVIIKFLENHTIVCYDGKNILIFLKHHLEMEINICMQDVQIAGSLLEPDSPPDSFGALQKLASSTPQYTVATTCPRQKTAWYLTLLKECADKLKAMLVDNSLWSLFQDIEMPVLPVIAEMEFHGILVDTEELQRMEGVLLSRMRAVEQRCAAAAGRALQLGSPAQLAAVLYDQLQLHTRANLAVRHTLAKGNKSTSEEMLRMLVPLHPLPALILEYRRLHKAHATFLAGVRHHVRDGVLKPTWVQTAAATGRVACNNPNVQAIPKLPFSLSSDAESPEEALNLRSVYVARPGHVLLAADFRQIECRVFASAAADDVLLAALQCGRDLFTVLAAQWLKKPEEQVSAADRERTKRIVYASLYGAGLNKLMAILGVSRDQAAAVSASFHRAFPSLKRLEREVRAACWAGRAPRTLAGRARPLPALHALGHAQRARVLRQALNFLVQGTAADVCKVAMARAHAALRAAGLRARLLLQIHDELVWELPAAQLQHAHAVVLAAAEGSGPRAGLRAALPAACRAGRSWGRLADLGG